MTLNINGESIKIKELSLDQWREFMAEFLRKNHIAAGKAWDLMSTVRGPDFPSERPDMSTDDHSMAYKGRRDRKRKTVEVIRNKMFNGVVGGCARSRQDDHVTLPPISEWDHFDRHVHTSALILGLKVKTEEK